MTSPDRRWDELQTRWAQGEKLSPAEEQQRLAYAEHDALARRELELFAALRARGSEAGDADAQLLAARALEALKGAPRLRLVTTGDDVATEPPAAPLVARARAARIALPGLVLAAAAALGLIATRSLPSRTEPGRAALRAVTPSLCRAELVLSAGQVHVSGQHFSVGQRPLAEGEHVTTGEGRACLTIDPGIDVCLAAHTAVALEALTAARVRVRVERGTALASLLPRSPGSSFALVMGDVSATAHGTTYAARREGEESEVIVVEGTVAVARGSDERELMAAHSRVVSTKSLPFVKTPVGRSEEARLLALRSSHPLWSGAAVGVLELADGPPRALQARVDDEASLPLPLASFVSAGTHRISWRDAAGIEATSWVEIPAGETRRLGAPAGAAFAVASSKPIVGKPSATTLLERARRELARGKPQQALTLYEELRVAYPATSEARTVLVTIGKLELDLNRPERALSRFQAYLRDGGALAPEAFAGKARALRALGRRQEERRTIEQYLATYPDGFDAPLFGKRLRELAP